MTIQNTTRKAGPFTNATESPITGPFAFGFKIFALTDIKVVKSTSASATGATTTLAYGTDYTVTADLTTQDTSPGGSITLIGTTKLEPGYFLTILSNIDYSQLTKLTNYDRFMPDTLNDVHDKTVALVQQLKEQNDRTVTVPPTSSTSPDQYIEEIFTARDTAVTKATEAAGSAQTATNKANEVTAKYNLISPHFTAIDGIYADRTNLDTVATNISDVNSVGANIENVNAVADNETNINAVNSNKSNINTVAGSISNVNSVGTNISNINSVAGNATNINAVNANKASIDTVAGISSDVTTVAGISTDVEAVADNETNIDTVATNISNVNAVGSNIGNVNAVKANEANINAVKANSSNINLVAGDKANIDAVAGDLANIDAASGHAADAKKWAIGDPVEPTGGHSAKYYAEHMALSFKGAYSATTTYATNDFVSNDESSVRSFYVSLVDSNVGNPLSDTTKWAFLFSVTSGSSISWGNITGEITAQTDLKNALDAKADSYSLATNEQIDAIPV